MAKSNNIGILIAVIMLAVTLLVVLTLKFVIG